MLIFVLISLTCVSAADNNETSDIVEINEIDDEIISEDANNVGTFKELSNELSNAQSGSKIELTRNYTYNPSTDSSYKASGIRFSTSNLEIDGKGHTISGENKAQRIFYHNGQGLTIKNTLFTGTSGEALYIYNGLTLINCTFIDNTGESIFTLRDSGHKIINCTFINNKRGTSIAGYFENCRFINNTATNGGAIHASGIYQSTLRNCTFENNSAKSGGALYFNYAPIIVDCKFINNRATEFSSSYKGGGAISKSAYEYGTPTITNCIFINNTDPQGISLYAFGNWKISNSTFQNSSVAINSSMTNYIKQTNVNIKDSNFIDCNIINSNGNLTLSNNTFKDGYIENNATILTQTYIIVPGHIQEYGSVLILLRVVDDNGNSIYDERIPERFIELKLENEDIALDGFTQIDQNWYYTASRNLDEGKYNINISLKDPDELNKSYLAKIMRNGTLEIGAFHNFTELNNEIISGGNIITLTKDYALDITSEFDYITGILINRDNIVIDGAGYTISAAGIARIFNVTGENVTLKNINFINGYAAYGGAIYSLSDVTIENCNFTNNLATFNGGAAYFKNKGTVKNSQFTRNQAENGGAIYFENEATIKDSKFDSNTAKFGGAAYINGNSDITSTEFVQNTADRAGALYLSSSGTINESTFTSNNATKGLAIVNEGLLNIENTVFNDQNDGKWDNEIVLTLDGEVTLNNVTPKELDVRYYVDLSIDNINFKICYLDYVIFNVYASNDVPLNNGTITIRYNNTNYTGEVNDGFASIPIQFINVGECTLYISYYGGDKYESPSLTVPLTIDRRSVTLQYPQPSPTVTIDDIYQASLHSWTYHGQYYQEILIAGETLIFSINNINITSITNNDGVGVLHITKELVEAIGTGYKTVKLIFEGNEFYEPQTAYGYIIIQEGTSHATRINVVESVTEVNEGEIYIASLTKVDGTPIVGETIVFIIDDFYATSTTNGDGVGTLTVTHDLIGIIGNGTKNMVILFPGNDNFNQSYREVQINFIKSNETIPEESDEINKDGTYSLDLKTDEGLPLAGADVNLTIGNTTINGKTNDQGTVTFNIPEDTLNELKNGTHEITITYISNSYPHTITKNVTVTNKTTPTTPISTQITANAATYVINYGGTYSVTLRDANGKAVSGKTITFTLNGKNIGSATTNANGIASIKLTASMLKTAKYGTKNLIIKFNGDANYNPTSQTVKITIKKEKTKITAKKKTFKRKTKTKKYTITLKNSKGKAIKKAKLTIKIKGKKYTAKTNSKGKATFKIKKLTKKGKYKATITFKTTAYYLKATKKVKITIK